MKPETNDSKTSDAHPLNELQLVSDGELISLRARLEAEMRRRQIDFSVGDMGEQLVVEYFNKTPGVPNLLRAPRGTKNVDALSRDGDRYSIKTLWKAKKTGAIYPDSHDNERQLFEFILIVQLSGEWNLLTIYQLSWKKFVEVRSWDSRMSAWYVGCSARTMKKAKLLFSQST